MTAGVISIVDNDAASRRKLSAAVSSVGLAVEQYADGPAFLNAFADGPGCVVLEACLPSLSGLRIQEELIRRRSRIPLLFVARTADVALAVEAMRRGAFDFQVKPVSEALLLDRMLRALEADRAGRAHVRRESRVHAQLTQLTPREREVLQHVLEGKTSAAIAAELNVSPKTIEMHRARIHEKMGVRNVAQLVHAVDAVLLR